MGRLDKYYPFFLILVTVMCTYPFAGYAEDGASTPKTSEKSQAYLGIYAYELRSNAFRSQLELEGNIGLVIAAVAKGSPAEKGGLKQHDILLSLDNHPLSDMKQLQAFVLQKRPGDAVELVLVRKAKKQSLTIALGERPPASPTKKSSHQKGQYQYHTNQRNPSIIVNLEELMQIYHDDSLSSEQKNRKINDLLSKKLIKRLRSQTKGETHLVEQEKVKEKLMQALSRLPEASRKQLQDSVFDKDGKIMPNVRVIDTEDGPLLIIEEITENPSSQATPKPPVAEK